MTTRHRLPTAAQADAIRGIRAAFPPRRVMVFDKRILDGSFHVKSGGKAWVVTAEGTIITLSR